MFVPDGVQKVKRSKTGAEGMMGREIVVEVASQDDAVALLVDVSEEMGEVFVELRSGVGLADATRAKNGPLLSGNFQFAWGRELERTGFVYRDVVDKGGIFGAEFHKTPASKSRGVGALTSDATADIAAGKSHSPTRLVGAVETDIGGGRRHAGLTKVAFGFVTKGLCALG